MFKAAHAHIICQRPFPHFPAQPLVVVWYISRSFCLVFIFMHCLISLISLASFGYTLLSLLPMLGSFGGCAWTWNDVDDLMLHCVRRLRLSFHLWVRRSECNGAGPRVATHRRISILRSLHKLRYGEGSGNSWHNFRQLSQYWVNTESILSFHVVFLDAKCLCIIASASLQRAIVCCLLAPVFKSLRVASC